MRVVFLRTMLLLSCAAFLACDHARAQEKPSLAETVKFINDVLSCVVKQSSDTGMMMERRVSHDWTASISVENGKLVMTEKAHSMVVFKDPFAGNPYWRSKGPARKTELDATSQLISSATISNLRADVTVEENTITLRCAADKNGCWVSNFETLSVSSEYNDPKLDATFIKFSSRPPLRANGYMLALCDADGTARVRKAFEHLILLSGGKKSPF